MRKGLTEIVFILDRSGSMAGLEADTIGGFNSMMEQQKKEAGEAYVTTVLFDNQCEVLHDRVPINSVSKITEKDYYVRGCTALLDAVGGAVWHIGNVHKYAREEDRPEKTLFVITTDGMENASVSYGYENVKRMIERKQKKYGWEFIFIGANIDAIEIAGNFGIPKKRAVDYVHDGVGTKNVFASINKAVCAVRMAEVNFYDEALDKSGWESDVRADYQERNTSSHWRKIFK